MTTNDTIDILNTYRDRLKAQYEKPGWNKWALFGALASLLWLLIDIGSENTLETKDSLKLLIALIFLELLIGQLQAVINMAGNGKTKYIEFKKEVPNRLFSLLFMVIICFLIIGYSHIYLSFPYKICSVIYFGFLYFILVVSLLIPLVMKIPFPVPQGSTNLKHGNWIKNILLTVLIFWTTGCIYFVVFNIDNWKIYSMWKSAFVFFGLYFVLVKIMDTIQKDPLIDEIDNLIDDVVFNKINPEAAIANLKLIIVGLEFKDAIAPLLIEYFEIDKAVREKILYINQIMEKIKNETDETKKKALTEDIHGNIKYFNENEYLRLTKFAKKASVRLTLYKTFDHDTNEMKQTIEQINTSLKGLDSVMQAAKQVISELKTTN